MQEQEYCIVAQKACVVYDIVMNPTMLARMQRSELWMGFVVTVIFEGIETKHACSLSRGALARPFSPHLHFIATLLPHLHFIAFGLITHYTLLLLG